MRLPLVLAPDPDEEGCAAIVVAERLGGADRLFLLDTGAAVTGLVRDELTDGLVAVGTHDSGGVFGPTTADMVRLEALSVGPISLGQLDVCLLAPESPVQQNLLGMDVISRASWRLEFSEGALEIETAPRGEPAGLRLERYENGQPGVEVDFGEARATAVWDSGAGMTVVDAGFCARHPGLFELIGSATGTDSGGRGLESALAEMAPCTIGGSRFPSSKVAVVDLGAVAATSDRPLEMILGYSTFHHADWSFDFPRGVYEVSSPAERRPAGPLHHTRGEH